MKKIKLLVFLFMLVFVMFLNNTSLKADERDENFILYVSNQSYDIDPVDITISIDGEVVVQENFSFGIGHGWKEFRFLLSKGMHTISAKSKSGEANLREGFQINDHHWAIVNYWYRLDKIRKKKKPSILKHFSFNIKDEPVYFR